jgi:hypothetical protein
MEHSASERFTTILRDVFELWVGVSQKPEDVSRFTFVGHRPHHEADPLNPTIVYRVGDSLKEEFLPVNDAVRRIFAKIHDDNATMGKPATRRL